MTSVVDKQHSLIAYTDWDTLLSYDLATSSYAVANAGTGSVVTVSSQMAAQDIMNVGHGSYGTYRIFESFAKLTWSFDELPPGSTVISASLSYYNQFENVSGGTYTLETYDYDFGASLTSADWRSGAQLAALKSANKMLTTDLSSNTTAGAYNTLVNSGNNLRDAVQRASDDGDNTLHLVFVTNHTRAINPPTVNNATRGATNFSGTDTIRLTVSFSTPDFSFGAM